MAVTKATNLPAFPIYSDTKVGIFTDEPTINKNILGVQVGDTVIFKFDSLPAVTITTDIPRDFRIFEDCISVSTTLSAILS